MFITPENKVVKDWLSKKENISLLTKISKQVQYEIEARQLERFIFCTGQAGPKKEKTEEILSLLVIFIAETRRVHTILASGEEGRAARLKRAFINHLIEGVRKKDPFRKLYRNAQAAIRRSKRLESQSFHKNNFCFFRKSAKEPKKPFLTDDDLKEIAFPEDISTSASYEAVNKGDILIRLAEYFLDRVETMTQTQPLYVELNLFTRWLSLYTVLGFKTDSQDMDRWSRHDSAEYEPEALRCADVFAGRLSLAEQEIFHLFYCQGLKHKEIRERMGNASSLSYQKKKLETALRDFLVPFSWEPVKPAFDLFKDRLCYSLSLKLQKKGSKAVQEDRTPPITR